MQGTPSLVGDLPHCGIAQVWVVKLSPDIELEEAMADSKLERARPLSPHLQIYKPAMTMVMSVFHRLTGVALYGGTLFLAAWLIAAAMGKGSFEAVQWVYSSLLGRLILLGFSWALLHHMLGGIRHLIWDTGRGYGVSERALLARLTLIGSLVLTVLVWVAAYMVR